MAKIYKFSGYVVSPDGEDINIEYLIDRYTSGFTFMDEFKCGCEEFEWDDDLEINKEDANFWSADELYGKLQYGRVCKKLREDKNEGK